jgi:hypothetical protein
MSDLFSINENYLSDKELLNEASYKLFAELFNEKEKKLKQTCT